VSKVNKSFGGTQPKMRKSKIEQRNSWDPSKPSFKLGTTNIWFSKREMGDPSTDWKPIEKPPNLIAQHETQQQRKEERMIWRKI
jgi:hypothetical protein